jgi:Lrp/AsnC family leucine-responsive transcriptional regulator
MLDGTDMKILGLLERDARMSNGALAEAVGLTASSVYERVKKLEKRGVIKGYVAVVDPAAVGKPIAAFIRISIGASKQAGYHDSKNSVSRICLEEPEILECHHVAGEDCYVLKVRVSDPPKLERLIERIRSDNEIQRSVTSIVLSTVKESSSIVSSCEEAAP